VASTAIALLTPGNNSGVSGFGVVSLDGTTLTVDVAASGLTPNQVHPLHVHGFTDDRPERLAVAADDADGDGFVETPEGEGSAYGPVLAALTASGEAQQGLEVSPDFPVADAAGNLRFTQTYRLDSAEADDAAILQRLTARLDGRVLEFHGLDLPAGAGAGTPNEVEGAAGYDPQVPVAQGQLVVLPEAQATAFAAAGATPARLTDLAARTLAQLQPYSLNPAGTGPAAPEPSPRLDAPAEDTFFSLLLPSNGSGVLGFAVARFDEAAGTVQVDLRATGLTPGVEHASHIHGFPDDRPSLLPNYRLDRDLDGFVEDPEGSAVVAPVVLALTEDGSISNAPTGLDFPQADATGRLSLSQTYRFDTQDPAQAAIFQGLRDRFTGREVQLHGLEVPATEGEGTAGEVNGTAGYKANLPVANGILLPLEATGIPALNRLYDAALDREPDLSGLVYHAGLLGPFSAGQLANGVLQSPEWQERFGAGTSSDAEFVQQVYRNALNREADAGGLEYWTGALAQGGTGRAGVLLGIADSAEHSALVSDFALASRVGDLLGV
jgi:uncharacterized protein DUF4214